MPLSGICIHVDKNIGEETNLGGRIRTKTHPRHSIYRYMVYELRREHGCWRSIPNFILYLILSGGDRGPWLLRSGTVEGGERHRRRGTTGAFGPVMLAVGVANWPSNRCTLCQAGRHTDVQQERIEFQYRTPDSSTGRLVATAQHPPGRSRETSGEKLAGSKPRL